MHIDFYSVNDVGLKRPTNQDSIFAQVFGDRVGLFVVADGMGGHYMGEIASQYITEKVRIWWDEQVLNNFCKSFNDCKWELMQVLQTANSYIFDNYTDKGKTCGSTVVIMLIYEEQYFLVNVGDSRLYVYIDNTLRKLNFDHTYGEVAVRDGIITREEAERNPKREKLVEAIGCKKEFNEYQTCDVVGNNRYLLCSDGLYKMLPINVICDAVGNRKYSIKRICKELIKKVYSAGAKDNVSCIIVDVSDKPQTAVSINKNLILTALLIFLIIVVLLIIF